jgi:3D (Asp-Asp-Asp) domain-containing protein
MQFDNSHTKYTVLLVFVMLVASCAKKEPDKYVWKEISVKVTAYNSLAYQTSSNPDIAAWGDSLKPGMKCIAVSRDLLKLGLKRNTLIKIEGLDSTYLVIDKMHRRKRNQIDIYMGKDVKKAKEWGVKRLKIKYRVLKSEFPNDSIH